jgi:hypothetical protein
MIVGLAAAALAEPLKWSGLGLPLVGVNSIDGWGFGAAGEAYGRPPGEDYGYTVKITAQVWTTTRFDYTNDFVQFDWKDEWNWTGRAGFRGWTNLAYAGVGGDDVSVLRSPALERGNTVGGPIALFGAAAPIGGPLELYGQVYVRQAYAEAGPDTLLARDDAFGLGSGVFGDLTTGFRLDTTDRWPVPLRGARGELAISGGGTALGGELVPAGAAIANLIGWQPTLDGRLVFGGRILAFGSTGTRPFWEKEMTAGIWRNELGIETSFTGYGRSRSRGDAALAALVEVRPEFFSVDRGFFDFSVHASLYAEDGFLFDGFDPGPHLPTIGGGPMVLWQGAIQLRPFVAWGWTSETPGGPRAPTVQYSVSFVDPL